MPLKNFRPLAFVLALLPAALLALSFAQAQSCAARGDLDARFCDTNGDLIADAPTDKSKIKNPDTLVFSYTPVEDPAVYENAFAELMAHMSKATGRRSAGSLPNPMPRRSRRCARGVCMSRVWPAVRHRMRSTSAALCHSWPWKKPTARSATRCS